MTQVLARRDERGVTLIFMAITVFLTLGMAALAIDYGMIKSDQAEAQRAMDAAALAGASAFQESGDNATHIAVAKARATDYATRQGVGGKTITAAEIASGGGIVVSTAKERVDVYMHRTGIRLWFANVFGTSSMGISSHAAAEAHVGGVNASCIKPFLIPDMWQETSGGPGKQDANSNRIIDGTEQWSYEPGGAGTDRYLRFNPDSTDNPSSPQTGYGSAYRNSTTYPNDKGLPMLLKPQTGNSSRKGNWYYTLDGPKDNLRDDIETGCISAGVGDPPSFATGGKTGQAKQGINYLYNQDPLATYNPTTHTVNAVYSENSPRVI